MAAKGIRVSFLDLFDTAALGIALLSAEGRFLAINPHLQALLGYTLEELNTAGFEGVFSPEDALKEQALQRRLVASEIGSFELTVRAWTKTGEERFLVKTGSVISVDPIVVVCMMQDVTTWKRTERAFEASEARWRSLVENAPEFVAVLDMAFRIQFANRAVAGAECEEMLGRNPTEFTLPEDQSIVQEQLERAVRTRQPALYEARARTSDGQTDWWQVSVGPIVDDDQLVGLMLIGHDITEQKRIEAELSQRAALLDRAEALSSLGSWEWHRDSQRMIWSDETYRLLGLEPRSVEPSLDLYKQRLHAEDQAALDRDCAAYNHPPGTVAVERRVILPDGRERWLRLLGQTEFDAEGRPIRTLGTLQDVTEERRIDDMKSEFVSVVSHELRTPLTAVLGPLQMLSRESWPLGDAERRRLLDIALANVKRMARLVDDIFDYNRLETGRLTLNPEPTEAPSLVELAADSVAAMATAAKVKLAIACDAAALVADTQRIVQVLTNLLDNAIAFSPRGGTIHVSATAQSGHVRFCVSDEGPGVPEAFQPFLFERFRQADPSVTRRKGGTGLGLAICKGIVEQHGGRIWLERRPGPGATFCFELPAAK